MIRRVIARAVRLAQATSSTTSLVLLLLFNLVPLVGVLAWGWNVATILVLYWLENGIVGVLNIPKILLAEGSGPSPVRMSTAFGAVSRVGVAGFFVLHYGIFWLVHGIFVFALPLFASFGRFEAEPIDPAFGIGFPSDVLPVAHPAGPDPQAVLIGAIGLAIARGASFVMNYLGRREYRNVSPQQQAFAPYPRLITLHLTIIFGAFVSLTIGSPVGAIVVLVLIKTIGDLAFHVREHAAVSENAPGAVGGAPDASSAGVPFERPEGMVGAQAQGEVDVGR
jgi:Family of unknown function (DUF6498)